jgi:putative transposase
MEASAGRSRQTPPKASTPGGAAEREWRLQPEGPNMSDHHPPHIYFDGTWYIVTAATLKHAPLLAGDDVKGILRDALKALVLEFRFVLLAWVILDDHYHLLLKTDRGQDLSRFFARLHGSTARQLNLRDRVTARQVWHNYWDTCIRTETGLWTRFNYIHNNPVKHGYVQEWADWAWSSYRFYLETRGEDWLLDCWRQHPVIDYVQGDDFGRSKPPMSNNRGMEPLSG